MATPSNFVLLGTKTFAGSDFATSADRYWSVNADGTITVAASEALATRIDARPFKSLLVMWTGGFTNAVTMNVGLRAYPSTTALTGGLGQTFCTTAANGGTVLVAVGGNQPYANNAGADFSSSVSKRTAFPILCPYYVFQTFNSGDTGAVSSCIVHIYGIR